MHCQYVRDCLEVLRIGGGLDGKHLDTGKLLDDWKYIYVEKHSDGRAALPSSRIIEDGHTASGIRERDLETPPISLPPPKLYKPTFQLDSPCDPSYPHILHMFWSGPFTDKPYSTLLSFLYTQVSTAHVRGHIRSVDPLSAEPGATSQAIFGEHDMSTPTLGMDRPFWWWFRS